MAETRFSSDSCRISKKLQQMTDPGKYVLNVPGNGETPSYMADPHIILQKWGGNQRTNSVNVESELRGVNRPLGKDCLVKDNYQSSNYSQATTSSRQIQYPVCASLTTEQSRVIAPAWTFRDVEQVLWVDLPLNPQENTCMRFQNNISTRILERDFAK